MRDDDLCLDCNGKGLDPADYTKYCPTCKGTPSAKERQRLADLNEKPKASPDKPDAD